MQPFCFTTWGKWSCIIWVQVWSDYLNVSLGLLLRSNNICVYPWIVCHDPEVISNLALCQVDATFPIVHLGKMKPDYWSFNRSDAVLLSIITNKKAWAWSTNKRQCDGNILRTALQFCNMYTVYCVLCCILWEMYITPFFITFFLCKSRIPWAVLNKQSLHNNLVKYKQQQIGVGM